jgi:hypothetical protein
LQDDNKIDESDLDVLSDDFTNEPKLETKEDLDDFTKLRLEDDNAVSSDADIPDWLK